MRKAVRRIETQLYLIGLPLHSFVLVSVKIAMVRAVQYRLMAPSLQLGEASFSPIELTMPSRLLISEFRTYKCFTKIDR